MRDKEIKKWKNRRCKWIDRPYLCIFFCFFFLLLFFCSFNQQTHRPRTIITNPIKCILLLSFSKQYSYRRLFNNYVHAYIITYFDFFFAYFHTKYIYILLKIKKYVALSTTFFSRSVVKYRVLHVKYVGTYWNINCDTYSDRDNVNLKLNREKITPFWLYYT